MRMRSFRDMKICQSVAEVLARLAVVCWWDDSIELMDYDRHFVDIYVHICLSTGGRLVHSALPKIVRIKQG